LEGSHDYEKDQKDSFENFKAMPCSHEHMIIICEICIHVAVIFVLDHKKIERRLEQLGQKE
jgi:hypothetical protein